MALRILQVATADVAGGAEQVAMNLHRGFAEAGDQAMLAVGHRNSDVPGIALLDNMAARGVGGAIEQLVRAVVCRVPSRRVQALLQPAALVAQPKRLGAYLRGWEDFEMPATRQLLDLAPFPPDVLHCHNLHGGYFDLRELAALSGRVPTFLTLHDMWLLTGHCAYSLGCDQWRTGCGACPDLSIYPAVRRDATAENVARKRAIYRRSKLRVSAPSRWLIEKARASALAEGVVEWRVIPYGVDLRTFHPDARDAARARLGIPATARVLLYVANAGTANPFKDYATADVAVRRIASEMEEEELVFLVVGSKTPVPASGKTIFVPFLRDRAALADYYRAADLYLHAAREDNFPNTVIESQACGTPVVATAVGGIVEQVEEGVTGVLVPPGQPEAMAAAALALLRDGPRLASAQARAAARARELYDLNVQIETYRGWFAEVVTAREGGA